MTLGGFLAPVALVATGALAATAVSLAAMARIRGDFARRTRDMAESNRRLLITFDRAAVGMALLDPSGKWLRVNDRFCEIVGRPCEELLALSIQEITHPDDIEADLDLIDGLLAGGAEDMRVEKRYLRKDGSIVWAEVSRTLVRDSAGRPEFFVSVNQDISARKEAEDRLVAGEAQYRAILSADVQTGLEREDSGQKNGASGSGAKARIAAARRVDDAPFDRGRCASAALVHGQRPRASMHCRVQRGPPHFRVPDS